MKKILVWLLLAALFLTSLTAGAEQAQRTLSVGATGQAVVALQERLIAAGFLAGLADGKYGEGTRNAVMAAQTALREQGHRLQVDGIAGKQTLALLHDEAAMAPFIDFSLGASGQRVIALQNRLIDLKFLDGAADGRFGQQTLDALKAFQRQLLDHRAEGIALTGKVDAATRNWLRTDADLSPFSIEAPEFFDDSQPLHLSDAFLNARAALLVDARNGQILYAKNANARLYPASTTKMMTLLLAVERGGLDERVRVPASAGEVPRDSSLMPVYPGEEMRLRDLLYGLMIRSGNDAANAIAEICAGSVPAFVDRMNEKAAKLGMADTHFMNPHGYHHDEHYTTARDLMVLAIHGMANPEFAAIASALSWELPATQKRGVLRIVNSNELLSPASQYFDQRAVGIKSGYTSQAGFCYVGAGVEGSKRFIAAILGSRTRNRGWQDMTRLFNYGTAQK